MKKIISILSIFLFFAGSAVAEVTMSSRFPAPAVIPHTTLEMKSPGYWISRHPSAGHLVLDAAGIRDLNSRLIKEGLTTDLNDFRNGYDGTLLREQLAKELGKFRAEKLYDKNGKVVTPDYYDRLETDMNLNGIAGKILVQYGVIVSMSEQRLLPTADILTAEPYDFEFDEIQNSSLDLATPVVVLHRSWAGQWLYVRTSASEGWVKKESVALCPQQGVACSIPRGRSFVMVTSPKTDVFWDRDQKEFYQFVRMGTRFSVKGRSLRGMVRIVLPVRDEDGNWKEKEAYVRAGDVSRGNLSYTPAIIIGQAFKLLNTPYGWGGVNGEQDCSSFLKEIFATVGIDLPRNSSEQGKSGRLLGSTAEGSQWLAQALKNATPGITVVQLKGHMMLFLGNIDGQSYAIHETYGYRETEDGVEKTRVLNRVVVSDFSLGEGTAKGSLAQRAVAVREIQ